MKGSRVRGSMCKKGSDPSGTGREIKLIINITRRLRGRNRSLEIYKNRINKHLPRSMKLT